MPAQAKAVPKTEHSSTPESCFTFPSESLPTEQYQFKGSSALLPGQHSHIHEHCSAWALLMSRDRVSHVQIPFELTKLPLHHEHSQALSLLTPAKQTHAAQPEKFHLLTQICLTGIKLPIKPGLTQSCQQTSVAETWPKSHCFKGKGHQLSFAFSLIFLNVISKQSKGPLLKGLLLH